MTIGLTSKIVKLGCVAAFASIMMSGVAMADAAMAKKGETVNLVLLPKFLGILPFDQANRGAEEANKELENKGKLLFIGPTPENSVAGQIEMLTTSTTQKQNVVMLSNNAGDQIAPTAEAAQKAGTKVVTWDSPIPSSKGESVFVAQVDFNSIGIVMADMALNNMGGKGEFAVLSATPDAANQNAWIEAMKKALADPKYKDIKLVDVVYGDDQSEVSYKRALALVDKHKDLKLIMAPTTVGIAAAAQVVQGRHIADKVHVTGLGLPSEMRPFIKDGTVTAFQLWSPYNEGWLAVHFAKGVLDKTIKNEVGAKFDVPKLGTITINPGNSINTQSALTTFDAKNIDDYHF